MEEDIFQLGIKALITNTEGKMLLFTVNVDALSGYGGEPYHDIPGGRIHRGSTIDETLRREVAEETGITEIQEYAHFASTLANIRIPYGESDTGLVLFGYTCRVGGDPVITLSEEHVAYDWYAPREAAELLSVKYPKKFTDAIAALEG